MRLMIISALLAFLFTSCQEDEFTPVPNPNFVYFLVEDPNHGNNDSFILALADAEDIATARAMVDDPSLRQIVLAKITKNKRVSYYRNRDLINDKDWSWHISEFLGFVDNTIEIYDGWPQYVEDNYKEWVTNTKGDGTEGVIGFWSYVITEEVDPSELE